ncbi:MAG: hypothetical protein L6V84_07365 [Oscillospiraceae bacterium]|nr:MAG: hypothetical protein L6V84_07365 [Oscillospiraceae bacterium]
MFQQTFHFSGYAPLPFLWIPNNLHALCLHNARTPDFSRIPACFLQKQPPIIIIYYACFVNPFQVFPPEEKMPFFVGTTPVSAEREAEKNGTPGKPPQKSFRKISKKSYCIPGKNVL